MLELLWEVSEEKIIGIIVSIIFTIIFKIISPFINLKEEKKWKCKKNKCNYDKFAWYQFKVICFICISAVIIIFFGCLLCTYEGMEFAKAINIVRWSVSIICACLYVFIYFVTKKQVAEFSNQIVHKRTNVVWKILYYMPMIYCFWMWNIILHVDAGILNYIVIFIFIIYNIVALFIFSFKEEYEYKYVKFKFKDRYISDILLEDVFQKDEWIIVKKQDKEERFRYSDLEDIEYYNTSEVEKKILEGINITKN